MKSFNQYTQLKLNQKINEINEEEKFKSVLNEIEMRTFATGALAVKIKQLNTRIRNLIIRPNDKPELYLSKVNSKLDLLSDQIYYSSLLIAELELLEKNK